LGAHSDSDNGKSSTMVVDWGALGNPKNWVKTFRKRQKHSEMMMGGLVMMTLYGVVCVNVDTQGCRGAPKCRRVYLLVQIDVDEDLINFQC
jgi:hypothetical protein